MGDSKRWSVTHTKHLKQKRKVYQDGALELHASCQKVLLYDDCGTLLVSRFLKKDEVIESGGTLTFDTHLVDIGELEGICKPLRDLNIQRKDEKPTEKMGIQRQKASCNSSENRTQLPNSGTSHDRPVVMKKIVTGNKQIGLQNSGMPQKQPNAVHTSREWHALYTTHITQKAKRYHDGTLRLSLCGSHQRQVMLYDDCGKLLASRFLKKDELVESGVELAFDTHLVDIGDLEENSKCQTVLNVEGDEQSIGKIGTIGQKVRHNSSVDNKAAKLRSSGKPSNIVKGNLRNDDHSGRVAGSYSSRSIVDGFTSSGRAPRNDLLRDASKILSVLKKPVANESLHSVNLQMEQTSILQSSDLLQSVHQGNGQNASGVESSKVDAEGKCGIRNCRENTSQIGSLRSNFSQSEETQELPTLSFTNLLDPESKEKLQPDKFSLPSTSFPHMAASNTSKPQLDMEFTDKVMIDLTTPMGGSHATEVILCDSPENKLIDGKSPEVVSSTASCGVISRAPFSYSSEYKQVYESSTLTRSECDREESNNVDDGTMLPESSSNDVWVLEVVKEKPKQAYMDNVEPDAQKCEDAFLLGSSSSLGGPPGFVANVEGESTEEFKCVSEKMTNTDDFPSFDLGI